MLAKSTTKRIHDDFRLLQSRNVGDFPREKEVITVVHGNHHFLLIAMLGNEYTHADRNTVENNNNNNRWR